MYIHIDMYIYIYIYIHVCICMYKCTHILMGVYLTWRGIECSRHLQGGLVISRSL